MQNVSKTYYKIVVLGVLFLLSGFKTQQEVVPEQLDWDTHFRASPDKNSAFAALTVTNWHYSYNAKVRNNHLHIDFKFSGSVVPEKSWVKPERISNRKISRQLLNHEQGHVYINFLLLKNGEIQIRNQNYTISNYKKQILANGNRVGKYYSDMQDRYDLETKHGSDLQAQDRWDSFIREEMDKFER